jgi:hypothetical protein
VSHVVSAKVPDAMVQQGQHAIRIEWQDMDGDVQLALEAKQREEPARLDLLARVAVDDKRQILATVDLDVIGAVGKGLAPGCGFAVIMACPAVYLSQQLGQGVVIE